MGDSGNRMKEHLKSGVVILTGGRDSQKQLILTVPTDKLSALERWRVQDLTSLFMCQARISRYLQPTGEGSPGSPGSAGASPGGPCVVCVSDLRSASSLSIKQLVEMLESVEYQQRGTVSAVYFLKPQNKTKSHTLKKMLGVKPSKKNPKIPLFKVVLVKTLQDLHAQIDPSQLTLDFYGTLQYNHQAWMHLYEVVIECIVQGQQLLSRLPSVRDKVDLLQEYDTETHVSGQLQQLLSDLTEKYNMILTESGLPQRLLQTKQTLFSLDHPSGDDSLSSSWATVPGVKPGLRDFLHQIFSKLEEHNAGLEQAWRVAEGKVSILVQVQRHRERAKDIEQKISQHYQPLLQEHPIVGRTLSQAELYRAHFTTTLHEPAKELLSQATEILEAVHKLKSSESMQTVSTALSHRRGSVAPGDLVSLDVSDITQCLNSSMQPFAGQLQQLQQIYVNIHIFHLLFEKTLSWYKKVLKFLPNTLLDRCTVDPTQQQLREASSIPREPMLYMPSEWLGAVRVFLNRHPPPRLEHIERLEESTPHLVNKRVRAQAKSLALRLRILQRLLSSNRMPLKSVQAVLMWKSELFGSPSAPERGTASGGQTAGGPATVLQDRHKGQQAPRAHLGESATPSRGTPQANRAPVKPRRQGAGLHQDHNPVGGHGATRRQAEPFSGVYTDVDRRDAGDFERIYERSQAIPPVQHRRTAGARAMMRSRSVEFNFNSSSTDGSVLDYDRAVRGARHGQQFDKGGEDVGPGAPPNVRRRLPTEAQRRYLPESGVGVSDRLRPHHRDEQAFSDPSEIIAGQPRNRMSLALPDRVAEQAERYSGAYGLGNELGTSWGTPANEATVNRLVHPLQSDNHERFIRINLTPSKTSRGDDEFVYPEDVSLWSRIHGLPDNKGKGEEEESGFDTAEGSDPYDSLVNRIREISSSNYTNAEKLHKVSELLLNKQDESRMMTSRPSDRLKAAKSTLDLSRGDEDSRWQWGSSDGRPSSPVERPATLIQRMKEKLARSVEDLTSDHMEASPNRTSHKPHQQRRFRSELRIQPVFSPQPTSTTTPFRTRNVTADDRKHSLSDAETSKSSPLVTTSPAEGTSRTRTTSEVEEADIDPRGSLPTFLEDEQWSRLAGGDEGHMTSFFPRGTANPTSVDPTRTSPSRTFISPSFLRAAVSMQDLSASQPLTAANLGLLEELESEADMRMLRDMDTHRHFPSDKPPQFSQDNQQTDTRLSKYDETSNFSLVFPGNETDKAEATGGSDDAGRADDWPEPPRYGNDIIANFVMYSPSSSHKLSEEGGATVGVARSSSDTSPSWIPTMNVGSLLKQSGSFSSEEYQSALPSHGHHNLDRLSLEADREYQNQEGVAQSLQNTLKILQDEEKRLHHPDGATILPSHSGQGQMTIRSVSTDNGYSSWASRLVSALSTSSDGVGIDVENLWHFDPDAKDSSMSDDACSNDSKETT